MKINIIAIRLARLVQCVKVYTDSEIVRSICLTFVSQFNGRLEPLLEISWVTQVLFYHCLSGKAPLKPLLDSISCLLCGITRSLFKYLKSLLSQSLLSVGGPYCSRTRTALAGYGLFSSNRFVGGRWHWFRSLSCGLFVVPNFPKQDGFLIQGTASLHQQVRWPHYSAVVISVMAQLQYPKKIPRCPMLHSEIKVKNN